MWQATDPNQLFLTAFLPMFTDIELSGLFVVCYWVAKSCPTLCNPMDYRHQASLSFTISQSLLKFMSIELVMPFNHLILCYPLLPCLQSFPVSVSFPMSQFLASGGQSIGASASASVLPKNIQDGCPLGWTGWISLQSKGCSRIFNTTVQKHQLFGTQLYL